jgi:hypothetical protein
MIRLVIASLIFLCLFSCNNQPTLEKQYVKLINSHIMIPENLPFTINGKDTMITDFHKKRMKCIMYMDSTVCNVCNLNKLVDWIPLIEE